MGMGFAAVLMAMLAAAAAGLSGAVAALERRNAPVPWLTSAEVLVCVFLLALAGAGVMQLGRPQLIFAAFSNPSSSIFKLGVAWLAALVASVSYMVAVHRSAYETTCRLLSLTVFAACALMLASHAVNYVMPWRAAWNTYSIVPVFFGFAALSGTAAKGVLDAKMGTGIERRSVLAALVWIIAFFVLYLTIIGRSALPEPTAARLLTGDLAGDFWSFVVGVGIAIPGLLMLFARRSKTANAVAFLLILIGCAAWQIVLLRLGSAAWSFFGS